MNKFAPGLETAAHNSNPVSWAEIRPGRGSTPNLGPLSCAVKKATWDDKCEVDSRSTIYVSPMA